MAPRRTIVACLLACMHGSGVAENRMARSVVSADGEALTEIVSEKKPRHQPIDQNAIKPKKAIVVSMPGNDERLDQYKKFMHSINMDFEVLTATNGKKEHIPEDKVTYKWSPSYNSHYQPADGLYVGQEINLTGSERGCSMSHVRAWERVVQLGHPALITEDDAMINPDIVEKKKSRMHGMNQSAGFMKVMDQAMGQLPEVPDLVYLSYMLPFMGLSNAKKVSENLLHLNYVWTTTAYVITPHAAATLLGRLPVDAPVDDWLAKQMALHQLTAYATVPKVIVQAESWGKASTIGHSDEVGWKAGFTDGGKGFSVSYTISWTSTVTLLFFINIFEHGSNGWKFLAVISLALCYAITCTAWYLTFKYIQHRRSKA